LVEEIKSELNSIPHPDTGKPLVEHVYERDELYHGPHAALAPDLTVVLTDWQYRTIGLHDFTTNRVITPAFGPTGDHRPEGILIATGPPVRSGAEPTEASLLDIAPTVLSLLGINVPDDIDGRILTELLDQEPALASPQQVLAPALVGMNGGPSPPDDFHYTPDEDATIKERLADLGYL
jgi:predicted AlkP superfamily phosphohydrolase/phosphomutase